MVAPPISRADFPHLRQLVRDLIVAINLPPSEPWTAPIWWAKYQNSLDHRLRVPVGRTPSHASVIQAAGARVRLRLGHETSGFRQSLSESGLANRDKKSILALWDIVDFALDADQIANDRLSALPVNDSLLLVLRDLGESRASIATLEERDEPSARQDEIIEHLYKLGAVSERERVLRDAVIRKIRGRLAKSTYFREFAALRHAGYIHSLRGRYGGYWLTVKGKNRAIENLSPTRQRK